MLQIGISPKTVTVDVQVLLFPVTSFTVSVTVLLPMLEQLNDDLETLNDTGLQLSKLLLFIIDSVIVAVPPTNVTVTALQIAVGAVISCTVIVCVLLELLLQASVAFQVRVMV